MRQKIKRNMITAVAINLHDGEGLKHTYLTRQGWFTSEVKLSYSKDNWEENKDVVWYLGGHCMHGNSCTFLASCIYG